MEQKQRWSSRYLGGRFRSPHNCPKRFRDENWNRTRHLKRGTRRDSTRTEYDVDSITRDEVLVGITVCCGGSLSYRVGVTESIGVNRHFAHVTEGEQQD